MPSVLEVLVDGCWCPVLPDRKGHPPVLYGNYPEWIDRRGWLEVGFVALDHPDHGEISVTPRYFPCRSRVYGYAAQPFGESS